MKKKYFCTACYEQFEAETPTACPKCKHTEVAEIGKDMGLINSVIEKKMAELVNYNKSFIANMDNGYAGGNGGKKTIAKSMFDSKGNFKGMKIESLDHEAEVWAKNIALYAKYPASEIGKMGAERINKAPSGMNLGVPSEGGYLNPPTTIMGVIIEGVWNLSFAMQKTFKVPAASSLIRIPRVHQELDPGKTLDFFGGVTMSWLQDGGVKQATKPKIEYLQFTPYELAGLLPLTHALIEDSSINVVEWVTNLMIRRFAYEMDNVVINGNGAGKPMGILPDPNILNEARIVTGEVHLDDFAHLDERLNDVFDAKAEWILRSSIGKSLRLDVTQGLLPVPRWMEGNGYQAAMTQSFKPQQIAGRNPIYTYLTPGVGSFGDVILGDLDQYWMAVRKELTVDESDHFLFGTNEKCLRFVMRVDGKAVIPEAFVVLSDAQITP